MFANDELNKKGGILVRLKKARQTAIFVLVCWGWAAGADTYAIDPVHSMVGFSVRHMLIGHVSGPAALENLQRIAPVKTA
jgi:hypothetical protein